MSKLIGYYVTCDDAMCEDCFDAWGGEKYWKEQGGFESWEEPIAIFTSTEADTPTHCIDCGEVIEHALTNYGYRYIASEIIFQLDSVSKNPVIQLWINAYDDTGDVWDTVQEILKEKWEALPIATHPALEKYVRLL